MSDEALLSQVADNADRALKLCKAAWERGTLPRPDAERLEEVTRLAHCGAVELQLRAKRAAKRAASGTNPSAD